MAVYIAMADTPEREFANQLHRLHARAEQERRTHAEWIDLLGQIAAAAQHLADAKEAEPLHDWPEFAERQ